MYVQSHTTHTLNRYKTFLGGGLVIPIINPTKYPKSIPTLPSLSYIKNSIPKTTINVQYIIFFFIKKRFITRYM